MRRDEAIALLRSEAESIRARGAAGLYLFGSTLRDEADSTSDIDVFIDIDPHSSFSLFDLVAIRRHLEERGGVTVDVTTRDALHPLLKDSVESSALRIF
jgi:predicted nucleotidyltransferase